MEPLLLPWILNNPKNQRKPKISSLSLATHRRNLTPSRDLEIFGSTRPLYRLISYGTRDFAEMCRMMFAYTRVPYENVTMRNFDQILITEKSIFPMTLPILEWNGKRLFGNDAIGRLLAKIYNLAGQGFIEEAQADNIIGIMKELGFFIFPYFKYYFGYQTAPENVIAIEFENTFKPALAKYLSRLENIASQSRHEFFLASGVTYADFAVANFMELMAYMHPELLHPYPFLNVIVQNVFALSQLQEYLQTRNSIDEMKCITLKAKNEALGNICQH